MVIVTGESYNNNVVDETADGDPGSGEDGGTDDGSSDGGSNGVVDGDANVTMTVMASFDDGKIYGDGVTNGYGGVIVVVLVMVMLKAVTVVTKAVRVEVSNDDGR